MRNKVFGALCILGFVATLAGFAGVLAKSSSLRSEIARAECSEVGAEFTTSGEFYQCIDAEGRIVKNWKPTTGDAGDGKP